MNRPNNVKRAPRVVVALLALLLSANAIAASVAERSPFAQGLWWDPARSGNGFEIWNTADRVAVIWFTYDNAGRPVWYSATGSLDSLGKAAWPLLRHRWNAGVAGVATTIGSLRLNLRHAESAEVAWDIGGQQGTWTIQPLIVSGVVNELDHSGVWFDPANSGWGLSLTEQGDFTGGVLYAYDPSGAPTWAGAFARGANASVDYHAYRGTCPACPYSTPTSSPIGKLQLAHRSESEAIVQNRLTLPLAAGVNVDGARIVQLGRPVSSRPADRQLASFDDESALRTYLVAGMQNVPSPVPQVVFSAPPPTAVFSPTNLQESGVDEGDLVKSNGVQIYTYGHDTNGTRLPVLRIGEVADEGATLTMRGSVILQSGMGTALAQAGLFLHGDTLVSVGSTRALALGASPWAHSGGWLRGVTHVEILDASVPDRPVTRWRAELDGHLVASRRIGDRLYVVTRFVPFVQGFAYGATHPPALDANQRLLAGLPLVDLLPKVKINGGVATAMVAPGAVHIPPQGSREPMADMLVVTAIDLKAAGIAQTLAIVGSAETAYASSTSLVVASSRYELRNAATGELLPQPPTILTDLHQIRLGTAGMSIAGSASIEGMLSGDADKAAFRLSEHQGRLRAVTTSSSMWGGVTRNRLTIFEPSTMTQGLLKTVSYLPNERRPQSLGKPNEDLYGTRFVGDRLYAVTFRRVDPLYVVDLADSTDPKITGELEVTGFSDYLHPLPNGLLLGFGKDAQPTNVVGDGQFAWFQGLQLTLFDVADANRPRELQRVILGKRGSESALLRSHHAFSALMHADGQGRIAFPARIHDGVPYYPDVTSSYPWQYSGLMRFELRGANAADARLVPLPSLVTHSVALGNAAPDVAATDARSVQFRNGTIYVGNGRFWRQDAAGGTVGPF